MEKPSPTLSPSQYKYDKTVRENIRLKRQVKRLETSLIKTINDLHGLENQDKILKACIKASDAHQDLLKELLEHAYRACAVLTTHSPYSSTSKV